MIVFLMFLNYIIYRLNLPYFELSFFSINSVVIVLALSIVFINKEKTGAKDFSEKNIDSVFKVEKTGINYLPVYTEEKKEIETFDKVFQEIDFLLTEIKIAVSSLGDNSAEKVIKNNIDSIKDVIAFKTNISKVNKKENFILLSNLLSEKKDNIKNDFSIAIYGKKNEDDFRLNMILQSYGIFTRIVSDSQAMLSLIQNKVIQFVIMRIDNENDECLRMCEKIREKYSSLDLPIMFILNKYNSYLVEKFHNFHINDFLITPFDLEVLFSRIQIMLDYKKLFDENKELLKSEKEKTVFLYFVTHNVNTPLTVLLNEVHALNDYKDALSVNNDDGGGVYYRPYSGKCKSNKYNNPKCFKFVQNFRRSLFN